MSETMKQIEVTGDYQVGDKLVAPDGEVLAEWGNVYGRGKVWRSDHGTWFERDTGGEALFLKCGAKVMREVPDETILFTSCYSFQSGDSTTIRFPEGSTLKIDWQNQMVSFVGSEVKE